MGNLIRDLNIEPNYLGKILSLSIQTEEFKLKIDVSVFCVVENGNKNNIGTILEEYRSNNVGNEEYIEQNREKLSTFIQKLNSPYCNYIPDFLICFYPADLYRKRLLECFKNKLIENIEKLPEVDFSQNFKKKDPSKSIKKDGLNKEDFKFSIKGKKPFEKILIIDDVIDEGKTVEIFLEYMLEDKLIDKNTNIKFACIYNRPKSMNFDLGKILYSN